MSPAEIKALRPGDVVTLDREPGPGYVYALKDPRDGVVRYVGSTGNPAGRLAEHISIARLGGPGRGVYDWLAELLAAGERPIMVILDVLPDVAAARVVEARRIREHAATARNGAAPRGGRPVPVAPEGFSTIRQAAERLGVSRQRVYQRIKALRIRPRRIGGVLMLPAAEVERLRREGE